VPGGGHASSQIAPGIEQVLVDRVAVGSQLDREHVDRDLVERDRHEHLALALGQLADRDRQRIELLASFGAQSGGAGAKKKAAKSAPVAASKPAAPPAKSGKKPGGKK